MVGVLFMIGSRQAPSVLVSGGDQYSKHAIASLPRNLVSSPSVNRGDVCFEESLVR